MARLACTRFTDETWDENISFRKKYEQNVIYGSSVKIREIYEKGGLLFVIEMNNTHNKIEGIGLIRNSLVDIDRRKIYKNNEYNRFVYKGYYWLSRSQLLEIDSEIIEIFDNILFKGKSNLKRFLGITILTKKLFTNWSYEYEATLNKVKCIFINTFRVTNTNTNTELSELMDLELKLEEV